MQDFSLFPLLNRIRPWFWRILLISAAAAIITGVISLFQKDYYVATTSFYAANPLLASPSPVGYGERSTFAFGNANDLDRLIAIGQSQVLINHLIKKFDLATHYNIDTSTQKAKYLLQMKVRAGYSTIKNKLDALDVSFESTDPELCAAVANEARDFINNESGKMLKSTNSVLLDALKSSIGLQEILGNQLADSIIQLKQKYGMVRNAAQGDFIVEELVKATGDLEEAKGKAQFYKALPAYRDSSIKYQALAVGLDRKVNTMKSKGLQYNEVTSQMQKLENEFAQLVAQSTLDKERIKQYAAVDNNPVSALHIIDIAQVPLIKSKPHRSMIVIAAFVLTAILMSLIALFIESSSAANSR